MVLCPEHRKWLEKQAKRRETRVKDKAIDDFWDRWEVIEREFCSRCGQGCRNVREAVAGEFSKGDCDRLAEEFDKFEKINLPKIP